MPKRPSPRSSQAAVPVLWPCCPPDAQQTLYVKAAHLPVSQWEPSGQTVPPVSFIPTGRFIKYNVALCIMAAAALARGLQSGDKHTRAGTLLPSSLASPTPTGRHSARQPHRSAAYRTLGGSGGRLAVARGDMSSLGRRASDATQRRAMAPFQMLPAHRPPLAMCSCAARLAWLCLMAARHQRGTAPLASRSQCGAQKAGSLFH